MNTKKYQNHLIILPSKSSAEKAFKALISEQGNRDYSFCPKKLVVVFNNGVRYKFTNASACSKEFFRGRSFSSVTGAHYLNEGRQDDVRIQISRMSEVLEY